MKSVYNGTENTAFLGPKVEEVKQKESLNVYVDYANIFYVV